MFCPSGEKCGSSISRTAAKSSGFKGRFSAAKAADRENAKAKRAMIRSTVMGIYMIVSSLASKTEQRPIPDRPEAARSNAASIWKFGGRNGDKPPANRPPDRHYRAGN